ncbi:hypothetical protein MY1884_000850 [Beauveria asiatica]
MRISTVPLLAALAGSTIAGLVLPFASQSANVAKPPSSHEPINGHGCAPSSRAPGPQRARRGQFTLRWQDGAVCPSREERQWTGTIDVSNSRRLFFWAFDSRNDPENDPYIFWMHGGPGESSMAAVFTEMGPCMFRDDGIDIPEPNPWSWNRNANLVFLDQPAGVGFSSIARSGKLPDTDVDGAQDFQEFLNIFFRDVFPKRAHLPIHIATEKYGGHWGPTYVDHILTSRQKNKPTAFWGNITSMILVDPMIDFGGLMPGFYQLLCKDKRGEGIMTEDQCAEILDALPNFEALARQCRQTMDIDECAAVGAYADTNITAYYRELVEKGERSPDHLYHPCADPPDCHRPMMGNLTEYLNRREVKMKIGFPDCFNFTEKNHFIQSAYFFLGSPWVPTTHKIAAILDAYKTPKMIFDGSSFGDVRILVLNGNLDPFSNTQGNMDQFDNINWSRKIDYRIASWQAFNKKEFKTTGLWKGTKDGRLVFVGVDNAGGMVPADSPEASYIILDRWLRNEW